ncbi:hypothetical protein Syun_012826 [Stephania yunnanensis]|uniref:HMA domain-containing protein n=1 Tax=Stephania yunnanensis TaxID=152371 RepID=A0AAP0PJU1_9MAGN
METLAQEQNPLNTLTHSSHCPTHSLASLISLAHSLALLVSLARLTRSRTRVCHRRRQHSLAIAIVGVVELGFNPSSPPPLTLSSLPSSPHRLSLAGTIDLKTSCPICKSRCFKDLYVGRAQTKAKREQMIPRQVEERKKEQLQKYEGSNVYVKNVSDDVDDVEVQENFSKFGKVASAKIMHDKTGVSEGTSVAIGDLELMIKEHQGYIGEQKSIMQSLRRLKVVFLKQRPQSRPCKGSTNICLKCERILQKDIHCDGCKQDVNKLLQRIEGVYTVNIDADQQKVLISGSVDTNTLIKKLVKSGLTFALAALPCSTPVLASILGYVVASRDPVIRGSLLLTCTTGYIALLLLAASFVGALQGSTGDDADVEYAASTILWSNIVMRP